MAQKRHHLAFQNGTKMLPNGINIAPSGAKRKRYHDNTPERASQRIFFVFFKNKEKIALFRVQGPLPRLPRSPHFHSLHFILSTALASHLGNLLGFWLGRTALDEECSRNIPAVSLSNTAGGDRGLFLVGLGPGGMSGAAGAKAFAPCCTIDEASLVLSVHGAGAALD